MNRETDEYYQTGGASGSTSGGSSLLFWKVPRWIVWLIFITIALEGLRVVGLFDSTSHWIDTHQGWILMAVILYVFRKRVYRLCKRFF